MVIALREKLLHNTYLINDVFRIQMHLNEKRIQ